MVSTNLSCTLNYTIKNVIKIGGDFRADKPLAIAFAIFQKLARF